MRFENLYIDSNYIKTIYPEFRDKEIKILSADIKEDAADVIYSVASKPYKKSIDEIAIELDCSCIPTQQFAEDISDGVWSDKDYIAYYHNGYKESGIQAEFSQKSILKMADKYPYICLWKNV